MSSKSRSDMRTVRHKRIRKHLTGTSERPRLSVYKSLKHISAQVIDDTVGKTLVAVSTQEKGLKAKADVPGAKQVGQELAKRAKEKGIKQVVFDRGGYRYHGVVAGLAEGAREGGLEF